MSPQQGWLAKDLEKRSSWLHHLTAAQLEAIDQGLRLIKAKGLTFETLTPDNFPLEPLRGTFDAVLSELENGLGFAVIRGLPAEKYSKDDMRLLYWGMGLHLGTAVTQSSRGDMLGDVRDFGVKTYSKKGRGYMSNQHLQFHADSCDVVCLMVLRAAKQGGVSRYASTIAVHDEVARTRPDLLEVLYQPFYLSWKGQEQPGEAPYYLQPMFSKEDGKLASRFIPQHVIGYLIDPVPGLPALTELQREALDYVLKLANDPRFYSEMNFEPGDMQFMNNHIMLHSRTEFEDYEEPDRKRHLIRLWLSVPNSRKLNDSMDGIYKDRRAGVVRGGFPCHSGARSYETPAITD